MFSSKVGQSVFPGGMSSGVAYETQARFDSSSTVNVTTSKLSFIEDDVDLDPDLIWPFSIQYPVFPITVSGLVELFRDAWRADRKEFDFFCYRFDVNRFKNMLIQHVSQFKKGDIDSQIHFGYIEKIDLDPAQNPHIYMRADLHGDLKSLIDNLMTLKDLGMLDNDFKCCEGVHLVFLGDYCDRGCYGTETLELLMRLREENPKQVHLIRGNHEYTQNHFFYANEDFHLTSLVSDSEARVALEEFYETMALTSYFSCDVADNREYIQCTHGLFELAMDPSPLLDAEDSKLYIAVPRPLADGSRIVSRRVAQIQRNEKSLLHKAAKRICEILLEMRKNQWIWSKSSEVENSLTAYNWGDISTTQTSEIGCLGNRTFKLSGHDIKCYLNLSSDKHRVVMLFRGHEHKLTYIAHGGKALVTTLPVGMNSIYKNIFEDQLDTAYLIRAGGEISHWKKRAILSNVHEGVTEVTEEYALSSIEI